MKKLLFISILALAACSKRVDDTIQPVQPKTDYFSQVNRYNDGRVTDTVWTLKMMTPEMTDNYKQYDGYIYDQTSTYKTVGVLWSK